MEVGPAGGARARPRAIAAAQCGACRGRLGYTETLGIPVAARAHRPALCASTTRSRSIRRALPSPPARRAAFVLAFLALFEPGDRVAVAVPGYPPYRHILTALGCEPVLIETTRRRAGRSPARC